MHTRKNRVKTYLGAAFAALILFLLLGELEAFEAWYRFTKDHENLELNELLLLFLISTLWLLGVLVVENRDRKRVVEELEAEVENRLEAEEALKAANRSKDMLFAAMSHDLRTPLNGIIGYSQLVSHVPEGRLDEKAYRAYMRNIEEAGTRLLRTITQVLDVNRLKEGGEVLNTEDFNIVDEINACISEVYVSDPRYCRDIDFHYSSAGLRVSFDRTRFRQAVTNLLTNAIKYSDDGTPIVCHAESGGDGVRISVIDQGQGISEQDLARITEPFVRTKSAWVAQKEGNGLGLWIAKRVAQLHDGDLTIESELGAGTTVTIWIPPHRCLIESGSPASRVA